MSGFEVAGVVLGAIPLIIEAIKAYKAGKSAASMFVQWRGLLDRLLDKLEFQDFDFYMSIRNLLQAAGVEVLYDDKVACREALCRPENQHLLNEYLGAARTLFDQTVRNYETYLRQIASKLSGIRRVPNASKDDLQAILDAPKEAPGKLALSRRIKFTMEKKALDCLIQNLDKKNLALDKIIDKTRTYIDHRTSSPGTIAKAMVRKFNKFQKAAELLSGAIESAYQGLNCHPEHRVMLGLTAHVDGVQGFHTESSSHAKLANDIVFTMWFRVFNPQGQRWCAATIRAAWPEMVDDPTLAIAPLPSPTPLRRITQLGPMAPISIIRDMCNTIQSAISGQDCPYFCIKSRRLHLSATSGDLTTYLQIHEKNVTLQEFLDNTMGEISLHLGIPDRMKVALTLASSILQLQGTPWLHPIWNDTKICFPCKSENWKDIDPKKPTVPYVVPAGQMQGGQMPNVKPMEVMLELAIILLELYHHQSFDQWAATVGEATGPATGQRRNSAIEWLKSTENMIVESYAAAIGNCLAICANPIHKWEDAALQEDFCENIILQLKKMCK